MTRRSIALVFCPYFSMRAPHFGLCRSYTEFLAADYPVEVFDIDSWIKQESREWYKAYLRAILSQSLSG